MIVSKSRSPRRVAAPATDPYEERLTRLFAKGLDSAKITDQAVEALTKGDGSFIDAALLDAWVSLREPLRQTLLDQAAESAGPEVDALAAGAPLTKSALAAASDLAASMNFDAVNWYAFTWAHEHAGALITAIDEESRKLVRFYVEEALSGQQGYAGIPALTKRIAGVVGLPERWAGAPGNAYESVYRAAIKDGKTLAAAEQAATKAAAKTRDRLIKSRARMIARTEVVTASNQGRMAAWKAAEKHGMANLSTSTKRWIAGADWGGISVCPKCSALDGTEVGVDEDWSFGGNMPPAHPSCRCTAVLIPAAVAEGPSLVDLGPAPAPVAPGYGRTFGSLSSGDGAGWGQQVYGDWIESTRADHGLKVAFHDYSQGSGTEWSRALRGQHSWGLSADVADEARLTARALQEAPALPEAITVSRGAAVPDFDWQVGAVFRDEGFISTSLAQESAFSAKPIQMTIEVPAGSRGAYLGDLSVFGKSQAEFLLPPGADFDVLDVVDDGAVTRVRMRLRSQDSLTENLESIKRAEAGLPPLPKGLAAEVVDVVEDVVPPAPAWEAPKFDRLDQLKKAPSQPTLGGGHAKVVLVDDAGTQYLFKPMTDWVADGEVAASAIARRAGLDVPELYRIEYQGETGSLQRMIPNARGAWPGGKASFDPLKLSQDDLDVLQRHRVLDWLVSNHDAHAEQWVREGYASSGGKVVGIDKGQAYKYWGKDKLDWSYHPNAAYGEAQPVHNLVERAYADGSLPDGQFRAVAYSKGGNAVSRTIDDLEAIPDNEFRAMLRSYAEGRFRSAREVEQFLDEAVERKNGLRTDFARYHDRLQRARRKAKGPKVKFGPPAGGPGGPKGMAGALASKADHEWMKANDSPIASTGSAPGLRRWTGSDYSAFNRLLRSEGADYRHLDRVWLGQMDKELGAAKSDFMVERATRFEHVLPSHMTPGDLQGHTLMDHGYVASSAGGDAAFSGDVYLRIRVNAGTPGSYIDAISHYSGEREFLIGRGQHFYVHTAKKVGGRWELEVEVVSEEWAARSTRRFDPRTKTWVDPRP